MLARLIPAVLILTASAASANSSVEQIRARGKLIVSVKNDAPHSHKDPAHANKRGFEIELAQAIAQRLFGGGSHLELRLLARPVRIPMLATGAVDLVISMIPVTAENARLCDLSHPYFSSGLSLLTKASTHPTELADLEGKSIAFRKQSFNRHGAELQRIADASGIKVTIQFFDTFDQAVNAVTKGEVAAMGGNFVDLDAYRGGHPGFQVNTKLLEEQQVAVAVKKGDADLLRFVNETVDDLKRTGELKRMTEKWHLPYLLPPS